jgi:hypothetical protein
MTGIKHNADAANLGGIKTMSRGADHRHLALACIAILELVIRLEVFLFNF